MHTLVAFGMDVREGTVVRWLVLEADLSSIMMEAVLSEWLSGENGGDNEEATESLIDYNVLETLKELTDGQHIDIVESYLDFARQAVSDIVKAVENNDSKAVSDIAHGLKASSKQLGAMQLGDLSSDLEARGLSGELGDVDLLIQKFADIGVGVIAEFEAYLLKHRAGS
ncbi:MAG: Hpt domain-containing protein [Kordiimonas sp.]